jgi:hypothetical protein
VNAFDPGLSAPLIVKPVTEIFLTAYEPAKEIFDTFEIVMD